MKKMMLLIGAFCYSNVSLFSNIGPQGFSDFLNHYFVETGTLGGTAIVKALGVGFEEVRSIEFDSRNYADCVERFKDQKNVQLFHGNSSTDLWDMIYDIERPITFWLDAHVYPPRTDGGKNCPLLEELDQIKKHPLKNHTILIDDMHCCGSAAFDYLTQEDLKRKILEINPDYQIFFVPGGDEGEYPENVMVAKIF